MLGGDKVLWWVRDRPLLLGQTQQFFMDFWFVFITIHNLTKEQSGLYFKTWIAENIHVTVYKMFGDYLSFEWFCYNY